MAMTLTELRYGFQGGYPDAATIQQTFDDIDLLRAMQMYRVFYPSVSGAALFNGIARVGVVPNRIFGSMDTQPRHNGFTLSSDTPYATLLLDLHAGPMVIEVPPGALVGSVMDIHQRWILDLGLIGPDAGSGGRHLVMPPGSQRRNPSRLSNGTAGGDNGDATNGAPYSIGRSSSFRVIATVRAIPVDGDVIGAIQLLQSIKVHPLRMPADWSEPTWTDLSPMAQDSSPYAIERTIDFWHVLADIVDREPPIDGFREHYGELAAIGIVKGHPFKPDARQIRILEQAARNSSTHMRVEAFADRRSERMVWHDRQWQWAVLRSENGSFDTPNYRDTYARDKWFFQGVGASPGMFRRDPGATVLYWLGVRDKNSNYLDGSRNYRLVVPQPVPGKQFWSVTVYDAETRSQIVNDQGRAALRSLFELTDPVADRNVELFFGPKAPAGREGQWIKTSPRRGWFAYFRIYGPELAAFDGSWKPGDFEEINESLVPKVTAASPAVRRTLPPSREKHPRRNGAAKTEANEQPSISLAFSKFLQFAAKHRSRS